MGVINKTTEKINVLLDKMEVIPEEGLAGKTPVLEDVKVTTLSAGSDATGDIVRTGIDSDGNPSYVINLGIPRGKDGTSGGSFTIDWANVLNKPEWIMSSTKPSYTAAEVGALPSNTSFKTVNGESILGEGDIEISSGGGSGVGRNYPGYKNAEIFNDYANNKAAGAYAHAEGRETNATGPRAHAEGYKTKVFAADAHAEGRETWCLGPQAHVEGFFSICLGGSSHVEGMAVQSKTPGEAVRPVLRDEELIRTFVSNFGTNNEDNYDDTFLIRFEELYRDYCVHMALGERSHEEGANNLVCDNTSHVEGYNNICGDLYFGHGALLVHKANHVEGSNNILHSGNKPSDQNYCVHIEGDSNIVYGGCSYSHIGGQNCRAGTVSPSNGMSCHSFGHGLGLILEGDNSTAFGRYNRPVIDGKKVIFAYGIGGGDAMRENAISILEDGTVIIPGIQRLIEAAILPLENKVSNNYNELKSIVDEQASLISDLLALLQSGSGIARAFVAGSVLVLTKNIQASVSEYTLIINDSLITVEDNTLTIK